MISRAYLLSADGSLMGDPLGMVGADRPSEIEQMVLISLFSDARAADDITPPDGSDDLRGWWADAWAPDEIPAASRPIGSRLWLLRRQVATAANVALARAEIARALSWLVTAGIAARVEVVAERRGLDRVDVLVTISRGSGDISMRFAGLWG